MATEFHLPDIGEGLTEAVITRWHVAVGESVAMDAPLVEVETDKAVVDIPSPVAGVLLHQGAVEGETLPVEAVLAVVGAEGEAWSPGTSSSPAPAEPPKAHDDAAPIVGRLDGATEVLPAPPSARPRMLPMVRRLAGELGVDTDVLTGSGPDGRVTEDDVRRAATPPSGGPERRIRMSPLRRRVAKHLSRSWREIPHVTVYDEAEATAVLAERESAGRPPLEAVLIRRLVPVLVAFPVFNASVEGDEIVHRLHYDVGFAVDAPDGLMVAVVAGADRRGLEDLGAEVVRLAAAARERTALPEELRGQTFTLSNIGAVGGRYGTPIIPLGTTAILSVGRADPRPVVRDGGIAIARELPLSLSYDHRAIDGATGRAFLAAVVEAFEIPHRADSQNPGESREV
jgi:pyruvate/2-oxoglutarate dehydrogenase complex dihydrolipoamide acyltransferase (E2) component